MDVRKVVLVLTLCVVVCMLVGLITETAFAAKSSAGLDNELSTKPTGLAALGHKEVDESKMPSKLQKLLGIGSVFVAIAVVKWL